MYKVFVDGQEGTTGLQIRQRLANHSHVEMMTIDSGKRKDQIVKKHFLNTADIVFLCLPDTAAKASVSLIKNENIRVIDASTAHRTNASWVYGLPELSDTHRKKIKKATRVSVPGCHATGFNLLMHPLIKHGLVPKDYPLTCHSLTGYSGGGKKLINIHESAEDNYKKQLSAPRHYALSLNHKHLPEMQLISGLESPPHFTPIVGDFYQGMAVGIPLCCRLLNDKSSAKEIHSFLMNYYRKQTFVRVMPFDDETHLDHGFFQMQQSNHTNCNDIFVYGNETHVLMISRLDNLGKGASGAAIQNMNIMLSLDETIGLK